MTTLVQLSGDASVKVTPVFGDICYGEANDKLKVLEKTMSSRVRTFSLLSGWSCPFAEDCLAKARIDDMGNSTVWDGPNMQWRCFSASQEAQYPDVYNSRKRNMDNVKACSSAEEVADLLESKLPKITKRMKYQKLVIRIHVGGDFHNQKYFDGWLLLAMRRPDVLFYAYTKSLNFWLARRSQIPENFVLTASRGGRLDHLIDEHNLREAVVVFSEQEAKDKGLEIDHDDSHAAIPEQREQSFALLIHGGQPAGSEAGKAVRKLKGVGSYGKISRAKVAKAKAAK